MNQVSDYKNSGCNTDRGLEGQKKFAAGKVLF